MFNKLRTEQLIHPTHKYVGILSETKINTMFAKEFKQEDTDMKCMLCDWEGKESELKPTLIGNGEYESRELCCPNCKTEQGVIKK